jgi:hypothetical protein
MVDLPKACIPNEIMPFDNEIMPFDNEIMPFGKYHGGPTLLESVVT